MLLNAFINLMYSYIYIYLVVSCDLLSSTENGQACGDSQLCYFGCNLRQFSLFLVHFIARINLINYNFMVNTPMVCWQHVSAV